MFSLFFAGPTELSISNSKQLGQCFCRVGRQASIRSQMSFDDVRCIFLGKINNRTYLVSVFSMSAHYAFHWNVQPVSQTGYIICVRFSSTIFDTGKCRRRNTSLVSQIPQTETVFFSLTFDRAAQLDRVHQILHRLRHSRPPFGVTIHVTSLIMHETLPQ